MSRFSVGNFLPHRAKNHREEPFNVSENLGYRKVFSIMGAITIFRRNSLVLQDRKNLYQKRLCFRKCLEWRKIKKITGWGRCHFFPSGIVCLTVPKIFVKKPSVFQKNWSIAKFYA